MFLCCCEITSGNCLKSRSLENKFDFFCGQHETRWFVDRVNQDRISYYCHFIFKSVIFVWLIAVVRVDHEINYNILVYTILESIALYLKKVYQVCITQSLCHCVTVCVTWIIIRVVLWAIGRIKNVKRPTIINSQYRTEIRFPAQTLFRYFYEIPSIFAVWLITYILNLIRQASFFAFWCEWDCCLLLLRKPRQKAKKKPLKKYCDILQNAPKKSRGRGWNSRWLCRNGTNVN